MIRIRDISLPPAHSVSQLSYEAAKLLRVSNSTVRQVKIVRKSIDARKKPNIKVNYTIDVKVDGNEAKILKKSGCKKAEIAPWFSYKVKPVEWPEGDRPVVVGFGPAGMFAGLVLAMAGCRPLILERGEDAVKRELVEELNMDVEVGGLYASHTHEYPDFIITLFVYECTMKSSFVLKEHECYAWFSPAELNADEWAPADADILQSIRRVFGGIDE